MKTGVRIPRVANLIVALAVALAGALAGALVVPMEGIAQSKPPPAETPPAKGSANTQDTPKKPTEAGVPAPPQDKKARLLPPVLEPTRSPVERRDLLQKFQPRHAIEGFYRLKAMVMAGNVQKANARGFLVVGQRHLSMQLYAPGSAPDLANIQAVFRKYRIINDNLVMSTLLGHRNKANGDIALERIGHTTEVRFLLTGAVLRLQLSRDEFLEFERIE